MVNLSNIYDIFAQKYEDNRAIFNMDEIIENFASVLKIDKGNLLDLGCGAGEPFPAFFLRRGWQVTGVDYSKEMLRLAQIYQPQMTTILSDMTLVDFNHNTFDAVTAIYSIFHIEKEKHNKLFENIYNWLKPNSFFLCTYACQTYTGMPEFSGYIEFMGEKLFYSHYDEDTIKQLLQDIGFKIISFDYHLIGGETFLWITVKK